MDERDNNITNEISNTDKNGSLQGAEISAQEHNHTESIDQPVYTSMPQQTSYDRFMYEPIGFEDPQNAGKAPLPPIGEMNGKKRAGSGEAAAVILFIILIAAAFGFAAFGIISDLHNSEEALERFAARKQVVIYRAPDQPDTDDDLLKTDENGKYSIEGVAKLVKPSIVEIFTYNIESDYKAGRYTGSGSGVVLNEDGYIVTNAHVLRADGFHSVSTSDGSIYEAEIVGRDVKTDIAVIKVSGANFVPATFGNSDNAVVGEQVIAIGNPVNLSFTVTDGIISAVKRKIRSDETTFEMECIQTNADISPGNSGGALINLRGEVIGITSSKYVNSSYEGLGFAITVNEALPIIEELIDHGYVQGRFRIGIQLIDMSEQAKRSTIEDTLGYKLPDDFTGIYIDSIAEDCDIANTALKPGDFITEINGVKVRTYTEFYNAISSTYGAGDIVPATCAHVDKNGEVSYYNIKFRLMEDTSGNY